MDSASSLTFDQQLQGKQFAVNPPPATMASNKCTSNKEILVQDDQIHQHHHQMNQISFEMMQPSSSSSGAINGSFNIGKDAVPYDLGELDQALFLYLDGQDHHHHHQSSADHHHQDLKNSGMMMMRPHPHTLNIFPSQPMHVVVDPSTTTASSSKQAAASDGLVSSPAIIISSGSNKRASEPSIIELSNPRKDVASSSGLLPKAVKREGNRKGATTSSCEQEGPKTPDPKTLRRLAQNREAARKSRLRKKAYVQQLESSRVRLAQLEQEIHRAKSQGLFFGGNAGLAGDQSLPVANMNSDTVAFDMEYGRWLEEHHRLMLQLRTAVQEHLPENELRITVENCLAHFDQIFNLKSIIAKSDVFHLISGMWKTPAERCFMWIGGFRPSELIKIILSQIEPLSEQQLVGMCSLQQSAQEAEEALTRGLEALNGSLSETIAADSLTIPPNMNAYMSQMAVAVNKLNTLEGFLRQADNLRQQSLHRVHQILTTRQCARCLLAIAEYFHRLRALSSLWVTRPPRQ